MNRGEVATWIAITATGGLITYMVIGGWNRLVGWRRHRRRLAAAQHEETLREAEEAAERERIEAEAAAKRQRRKDALAQVGEVVGKLAMGAAVMQAVQANPDLVVPGKITVLLANGSNPRTVIYSNGNVRHYFTDHQRYMAWCQARPSEARRSFQGSGPEIGAVVGDLRPSAELRGED